MTIKEQAKVYSGLDQTLGSNNLRDNSTRYMVYCGFRDGAKWMLGKVIDLLEDCEVFDRLGGRPIKAEDFRKALEE